MTNCLPSRQRLHLNVSCVSLGVLSLSARPHLSSVSESCSTRLPWSGESKQLKSLLRSSREKWRSAVSLAGEGLVVGLALKELLLHRSRGASRTLFLIQDGSGEKRREKTGRRAHKGIDEALLLAIAPRPAQGLLVGSWFQSACALSLVKIRTRRKKRRVRAHRDRRGRAGWRR